MIFKFSNWEDVGNFLFEYFSSFVLPAGTTASCGPVVVTVPGAAVVVVVVVVVVVERNPSGQKSLKRMHEAGTTANVCFVWGLMACD